MVESTEQADVPPPEINRFEWLWLSAMMISVVVAILLYDYSVDRVGATLAALINIFLFCVAALLLFLASRRQSNVARLLLVPFLFVIAFYNVSHLGDMLGFVITPYLAALRLGLMVAAIGMLFTPRARAWYTGRPAPPSAED